MMYNDGCCPYCSDAIQKTYHGGVCPKVKSIEYYPDGSIKKVDFFKEGTEFESLYGAGQGQCKASEGA